MKFSLIVGILGVMCILFGFVDFCGMFFRYDLTGTPISPVIAGLIGGGLIKLSDKIEKEGD